KAEPRAFVVLTAKGVEVSKFDTLVEAVRGASDGDTIEVRGNGPFVTEPILINHSLVIRAGPGFHPIIKLSATMEGKPDLITISAPLVVEGLELQREDKGASGSVHTMFGLHGGALYVSNCRLASTPIGALMTARRDGPARCEFRNCVLITGGAPCAVWLK